MALIMDYHNEQFDVTIPTCYWKIDSENGISGSKTTLNARFNCFKNKDIADTNRDKYMDIDVRFAPDLESTENFIAQAYVYAKTLPEFTGAVDA